MFVWTPNIGLHDHGVVLTPKHCFCGPQDYKIMSVCMAVGVSGLVCGRVKCECSGRVSPSSQTVFFWPPTSYVIAGEWGCLCEGEAWMQWAIRWGEVWSRDVRLRVASSQGAFCIGQGFGCSDMVFEASWSMYDGNGLHVLLSCYVYGHHVNSYPYVYICT